MKRRRPRWFRLIVSQWPCWFDAHGLFVTLVLADRYDLKLRQEEGQASPAALRLEFGVGRTREAIDDRLDWRKGWFFRASLHSDIGEISRRLAGFYPSHDNSRAVALAAE